MPNDLAGLMMDDADGKRSMNRFYTRPSFPERLIALAVLWGGYGWAGIDGEAADLA